MPPRYDFDKIKFGVDPGTFDRAVSLYEEGKVTEFKDNNGVYEAVVLGTQPYRVIVSPDYFDRGSCDCYLGQNDTLCKHIIAVAIMGVKRGKALDQEDKETFSEIKFSSEKGELSKEGLAQIKKQISDAMKYIKAYIGPSRIWFRYQRSLDEGCARLTKIISDLPVSNQSASLLVSLLIRIDRKLRLGGVDDPNGTVGDFAYELVKVLIKFAEIEPSCIKAFEKLRGQELGFSFEDPLIEILDKWTN